MPFGSTAVFGELEYIVSGVAPGSTATVEIGLPSGSDPTNVYKDQNGEYIDVTSLATITGNTVILKIKDGGLGDADHEANGVIIYWVVPMRFPSKPAPIVTRIVPDSGTVEGGRDHHYREEPEELQPSTLEKPARLALKTYRVRRSRPLHRQVQPAPRTLSSRRLVAGRAPLARAISLPTIFRYPSSRDFHQTPEARPDELQ